MKEKFIKFLSQDADVKRSLAYLVISLGVSGAKVLVNHIRERRSNH
jgi:hypothetical protein